MPGTPVLELLKISEWFVKAYLQRNGLTQTKPHIAAFNSFRNALVQSFAAAALNKPIALWGQNGGRNTLDVGSKRHAITCTHKG